jgi:hypothetical protein
MNLSLIGLDAASDSAMIKKKTYKKVLTHLQEAIYRRLWLRTEWF